MSPGAESDPSSLTTAQLLREIGALKDLVFVRLDGMDKAIVLFNDNITRVPTDTDKQIQHLKELVMERFAVHVERFDSVQTQFRERDTRTEQTSRDSKLAVDAALQAAKDAVSAQNKSSAEAITKSETSTNKQIDQIGSLINTSTAGINQHIGDIKDRLQRIESEDRGQKTAKTTQETSNSSLVSIIGLVLGTLVGIGGLLVAFLGKNS